MIKLIASDIDGTLIPEGTHKPPKELSQLVKQITDKGVVFVAASGRQYKSMHKVFESCADKVIFVASNGCYTRKGDRDIREHRMDREYLQQLVQELRQMEAKGYRYMAEAKDTAYVEVADEEFKDMLVNGYHYEITVVNDILTECDDIMKISLFHESEIQTAADKMTKEWMGKLKVLRSGTKWIDFMGDGIDKGHAIEEIQQQLGITIEETIVFGDNANDVGMFSKAGCSYAVESASEEVKAQADKITGSPEDKGVIKVLQQLLQEKEEE